MPDVFDIEQIDEVVHGRLRLGIMASLRTSDSIDFSTLKSGLRATDGNLSSHLRTLETAGYLTLKKQFVGRKPQTMVALTGAGRAAFRRYVQVMSSLVNSASQ